MAMGLGGVFRRRRGVALAVVLGGGSMGFGRFFVMVGGFGMRCLWHDFLGSVKYWQPGVCHQITFPEPLGVRFVPMINVTPRAGMLDRDRSNSNFS